MKRLSTKLTAVLILAGGPLLAGVEIAVDTSMPPPGWAVMQRELLRTQAAACRKFYEKYFDDRGFLICTVRWGALDGPDDAIENLRDWPILHSLGASEDVLQMYEKAWEGHLRQYTLAKTTDVEFARDGMYFKEFHTKMDWIHIGEGLVVLEQQALSDPEDVLFQRRMRRFAGLYMNEDPGAPNYDPEHKVIRSLFNGSRGPLLRDARPEDWAGDPIEIENRFKPLHSEKNYQLMLEHFEDYTDIVGDHPLNLLATSLATLAYMLSHEEKYKNWVLEYVDAWMDRMEANGGIMPSKVGLDGKVGGKSGKWYAGAYGWGFTVRVPDTTTYVNRNQHEYGLVGLTNAFLLTGDRKYLDAWRRQMDVVNANSKVEQGQTVYPQMYGDQGWYAYRPQKYSEGALDLFYFLMEKKERALLPKRGWLDFLEGNDPGYPERAMQDDFVTIRDKIEAMGRDETTPDTRLADDPMRYSPARVGSLVHIMLGGLNHLAHETRFRLTTVKDAQDYINRGKEHRKRIGHLGSLLHARLRYFDPDRRRPGIPQDVAALVTEMTPDKTTVTLVNVNQLEPRTVIVQGGSYGEHQCLSATVEGEETPIGAPFFQVRLGPGAGATLAIAMKRFANQPTLMLPWRR